MSSRFYYEDGQGKLVDELGGTMRWIGMTLCKNGGNVRDKYSNEVKLFNAAKSDGLAGGIAERTSQKWAKRLKEDKD
ncbi:hypothetical protein MFLAVUS_005567 [Mucor flavus]|uniref:Uncharacterized protein n=1 Tax=Mucor flavus TaxID=439312 RepID=A0ABP9YZ45_9FUNG